MSMPPAREPGASGKLQAGQSMLLGKTRQTRQTDACCRRPMVVSSSSSQTGQAMGGLEDEAIHGFILTEQVGTVAQQVGGDAHLPRCAQSFRQRIF